MTDFFKYLEQRISEQQQNRAKKADRARTPIYSNEDQRILFNRVKETLPGHYALFWKIAIATGWRTGDIAALRHTCIDLETGKCTIEVAKQSKNARRRAYIRYLKSRVAVLKDIAMTTGNYTEYAELENLDLDDQVIASKLPIEQRADFYKGLEQAVIDAPVKIDTKYLPDEILPILRDMKERNIFDDFVFSRRMLNSSNRAKNLDGHITRQSVYVAFRKVFNWFLENNSRKELKLSAYSLRKTFAYRVYRGADGKGANMGEVQELFNHSSGDITRRYLGLHNSANNLQRELARAI